VKTILSNPVAVGFAQSRNPVTQAAFWVAGFDQGKDGVFHTRSDALQLGLGYSDDYDKAANLGTDIDPKKTQFTLGTKSYVFWAWKGDYQNTGAGGEIGLYSQDTKGADGLWDADPNGYVPKMTMTLRGADGALIASDTPNEAKVWTGAYNPNVQHPNVNDLAATMTVDLSDNIDMFKAFDTLAARKDGWVFVEKHHTASLSF
jgi:hypothetical protein